MFYWFNSGNESPAPPPQIPPASCLLPRLGVLTQPLKNIVLEYCSHYHQKRGGGGHLLTTAKGLIWQLFYGIVLALLCRKAIKDPLGHPI